MALWIIVAVCTNVNSRLGVGHRTNTKMLAAGAMTGFTADRRQPFGRNVGGIYIRLNRRSITDRVMTSKACT